MLTLKMIFAFSCSYTPDAQYAIVIAKRVGVFANPVVLVATDQVDLCIAGFER